MSLNFTGTNSAIDTDGFSNAIKLTDTGIFRVTNMPFCYVTKTDGAGWSTFSTQQVVILNNVLQNVGNCYNPASGLFTCPSSGRYRIDFSYLAGQGATGVVNTWAAKNGVALSGNFHTNTNGVSYWAAVSGWAITEANAGDTLCFLCSSGASAIYTADNHTKLMVSKIL